MNKLLFTIRNFNKTFNQDIRPTPRQLKQIRFLVKRLPDKNLEELSEIYNQRVSADLVDNPISYLITMLDYERKFEKDWNKK